MARIDLGDLGDLVDESKVSEADSSSSSAASVSAEDDADEFETLDCFELLRTVSESKESREEPAKQVVAKAPALAEELDILDPEGWFDLPSLEPDGTGVLGSSDAMPSLLEDPLISQQDTVTILGGAISREVLLPPMTPSSTAGKPIGTPLVVTNDAGTRQTKAQQQGQTVSQFVPLPAQAMANMTTQQQQQQLAQLQQLQLLQQLAQAQAQQGGTPINSSICAATRPGSLIWQSLKVIPFR